MKKKPARVVLIGQLLAAVHCRFYEGESLYSMEVSVPMDEALKRWTPAQLKGAYVYDGAAAIGTDDEDRIIDLVVNGPMDDGSLTPETEAPARWIPRAGRPWTAYNPYQRISPETWTRLLNTISRVKVGRHDGKQIQWFTKEAAR